jgi:hypothetical protein
MIDYPLILSTNYPTIEFSSVGMDYSGITPLGSSTIPTQAELDALWTSTEEKIAKSECKAQAVALLQATDWTTIPDVANPSTSNPYLMNQGAFIAWRSQVRALAVNPIANPVFPAQPTEQWSS